MENINELIKNQQLDQIKALLEQKPALANQPAQRGFSPLIMAAYLNATDAVHLLLDHGAEVNAQDASGNTALMGTCFKGYAEVADLLISKGADVNLRNGDGATALAFAVNFNQVDVAKLLLAHGAVIDKSVTGMVAQAKAKGNEEIVNLIASQS